MTYQQDTELKQQLVGNLSDDWLYFFALFARFEYAIKQSGFHKRKKAGRYAAPDWEKFISKFDDEYWKRFKKCTCTHIIFSAPPKKLLTKQGGVGWDDTAAAPTCNRDFIGAIKDIRNNLFHGDKSPTDPRDVELIQAATNVLEAVSHDAKKIEDLRNFCRHLGSRR